MTFPFKPGFDIRCLNYIVAEELPASYVEEIRTFWPDYNPRNRSRCTISWIWSGTSDGWSVSVSTTSAGHTKNQI